MLNLTLSETIRALSNGQTLPNSHILAVLEQLQDNGAEEIGELKETIVKLEEKLWLVVEEEKTEKLLSDLMEEGADYCGKYGEKGYSDPKSGIIFHNWNNVGQKIQDYLELAGYELEWSDEWAIDYENDKAYRTSGNSYHWESQIRYDDSGNMYTPDSDVSDWLDLCQVVEGDTVNNCLPSFISDELLEKEGYIKYNTDSFENGWHVGQTDEPSVIAKKLFEEIGDCESLVFKLDENSQFYSKFIVYYKLQD
jgi:hypothetical protein